MNMKMWGSILKANVRHHAITRSGRCWWWHLRLETREVLISLTIQDNHVLALELGAFPRTCPVTPAAYSTSALPQNTLACGAGQG